MSNQVQASEIDSSLKWRIRLLQNRLSVTLVIFFAAFVGGCMGIALFHSPLMSLLGFAMILASTADYWLGANYLVDANGIQSRIGLSLTAMQWKDVKRVVIEPMAVKLSPLAEGQRMDAFRGVILRTNPSVRAKVLESIRLHVPPETPFEEINREFPR